MRTLNLKKENVAELGTDELDAVVGGIGTNHSQCFCSGIQACYTSYDCATLECVATLRNC